MQEIMAEVECRFECKKRGRGAARRPRLERERARWFWGKVYEPLKWLSPFIKVVFGHVQCEHGQRHKNDL